MLIPASIALMPALRRAFGPLADRIGIVLDDERPSMPMTTVLAGDELLRRLDLAASFYRAPTMRGVASLWARRYLNALIPSALVAQLVLHRELPLAIEHCALVLDAEALPVAIRLSGEGRAMTIDHDIFERTHALLQAHIEPLARALAAHASMSPRVILASAAFQAWQVMEMLVSHGMLDEIDRRRAAALFLQRRRPDGSINPFFRPAGRRHGVGVNGIVKRICCLSYTMRELGHCGSCPLDKARAQQG